MIGKILSTMRNYAGIKQQDLAKLINFANNTLSQYENNVREPNFATIEKVANACGFKILFVNEEKNITLTSDNINREEI